MRRLALILGFTASCLVGCNDAKTGGDGKPDQSGGNVEKGGTTLLEPLVMKQKPDKVLSVREVLTKKEGETVIVSGQTPPENVKPFNTAVAAVLLMAPEDLATEDIKDELSCPDAATCPSCKKVLDAHALRVELVDASGAVIASSLEGFRGLKPGSMITIEGEVKRDGKDKKLVRVVAKKFYPG
ncbi:MAG TPA: hypothetical protein VHR66_32700 [Gemmataceae bacterium]|jgi:hypothetical protein|nr:hypothetical protein [Gemmataceae bacterium]